MSLVGGVVGCSEVAEARLQLTMSIEKAGQSCCYYYQQLWATLDRFVNLGGKLEKKFSMCGGGGRIADPFCR